jgi:hypothetical protein
MPNYVLGKDAKLYFSSTALTSTSSAAALAGATEFDNVQDVNVNLTKDQVEINSRANSGFKQKVGTLKDATISFKIVWKPGDTSFNAFRDAYLNDAEIAVWGLDGVKTAASGSQGPAGNFNVVNFSRNEPIADVITADVELAPSSFTHWFTA